MISNSLPHEEELLFTTPESLEQLHFDLLALAEEHQRTASILPAELQALHDALSADPAFPFSLEMLKEADFQLRERSACVVTLSQLAVRLVEGIREQQEQHLQIASRYQRQTELLREQIQCLTYRNSHIQTDVEYFREHLQCAENQLQEIANTQMEEDHGWQSEKDIQIQQLEAELDRIRTELQYYRLSSPSRKSIHATHLRPNASELSIKGINKQEGAQLLALRQTVQMLAAENQGLRREINTNVHSMKSLYIPSSIRQELCEQTERHPVELPTFERQTPSIANFERDNLLRNTSKSLLSPRSPHEAEEAMLSQTPSLLEMRAHVLSTEWSTKSFDQVQPRPKLIYLHEDEEEKGRVQETKETEESVKEAEIKTLIHVGVNTEPLTVSPPSQALTPVSKPFFQKLISSFPLLEPISRRIIRSRVRRSTLRANESLLILSG